MRRVPRARMLSLEMRFDLGTPVHCTDGDLGKLADLVVDPRTGRVTHLVVHTRHRASHLVPCELAEADGEDAVRLRCTVKEARAMQSADGFACVRPGELEVEDP